MNSEDTQYIYCFHPDLKMGKLFKKEVNDTLWGAFIDYLLDQGCKIAASDSATFKSSKKAHTIDKKTVYENPF